MPAGSPPAQASQKVHSKEQMKAPGRSAGRAAAQRSQAGFIFSIETSTLAKSGLGPQRKQASLLQGAPSNGTVSPPGAG
jgi:hypothetical protein